MADETEKIEILLKAQYSDFQKSLAKTNKMLGRFEQRAKRSMTNSGRAIDRGLSRAGMSIRAFAGGIVGGVLATAIAGITTGLAGTVRGIAAIGDEARRSGLGVREFQELSYVAQQTRLPIQSLIDGMKELSLRADEFITTGKGPGAEAFARLGYGADDLARRLEDPQELMLDIIDRMEEMDRAAQLRISDEIFGGTGGERFAELVAGGDEALRRMIDRAQDAGAVLDEDVIAKAAELDRRFSDLTTKVGNFFQRMAVGTADLISDIARVGEAYDEIFDDAEQAAGMLGDDVVEAIGGDSDTIQQHAAVMEELIGVYTRLGDEALRLAPSLEQSVSLLRAYGYEDTAAALAKTAEEMRNLVDGLDDGTVSGTEFEQQMTRLTVEASVALAQIDAIDSADFSSVISGVTSLSAELGVAAGAARALRALLPGGAGPVLAAAGANTPAAGGDRKSVV